MLNYIVREPKQATTNPPLLILLHGYGSNEDDLFSFAQELPDDLLIVSAQAPYQMGGGAFAWYAINFDAVKGKFSDLEQAATSVTKIASFIDKIKEKYNTNPDKTFVLGFSQGAILSYALSLNYPNKVQHVIALSGYIDENLIKNQQENTKITTDYYISHGTVDQVIPVDWARKAPVFLEENNLKNDYSEYNVGHGVAPQNFYSFKTWIENRL
ncbi:alpha/beta hydrolase [Tenacibaculum finnmarkense]|uniref:alpha/beta hydrolase n=1 Tax=Tenacibaculum finnmarkense TaxID=2781243 RepID=UPI0007393B97|nr:alpha/beta fold hydrolase [Tenacibaculum finnmarkense]ALU74369.1 phospholipase [Tenacibaculum dicentrarchi]MCD8400781.1 dienelactone hydrolase family protein [Tenacibaculum finnmarkense genomovar ulcerans]MCD8410416.1 dienelactone hydrolase family protein [Tenacibaculum finnmarkense genomovar ulcerans]MCD8412035.1 dienelactone hydrolase family protein [Tenacibaculum finnmarkense genomovar ulcerans]MCD8423292.1 dienelactone hydrolase family protein [Tenacibaculum finnmarkense genomovar ulcer